MASIPIQDICLVLLFSLHCVTAFNATAEIVNYTTAVTPQSVTKQTTLSQSSNNINQSQVATITRHVVTVDESVKFDCEASGLPMSAISWQKNGRPLEEVCYRFESHKHFSYPQLQFEYVLPPDSGNYTCTIVNGSVIEQRTFILHVLEKKEIVKPKIKRFIPQNLTASIGSTVHLQCLAEKQYNEPLPYMKLVKYIKIAVGFNQTKDVNSTERVDAEVARIKKRKLVNPYMKKLYDVMKDGDFVTILETLNIERSLSVHYVIDHVEMTDDAVFSCIAFNEAGFSKETINLHIIPSPTPSVYDLALAYAAKYGGKISKEQIPLAVTICLPVMLLVILVIGFIWWKENIKIKSKEEKLSLIKIKKLRELDNFSSLEHMGKFSSRMETKRSSFVSEGVGSGIVDEHFSHQSDYDDSDCDNQEHNILLGNGRTVAVSIENGRGKGPAKASEMIPLQDMEQTSETPMNGRSSAFGSHNELEWEPFDLKLDVPTDSEFSQMLESSA